jgi:hypothetical protein
VNEGSKKQRRSRHRWLWPFSWLLLTIGTGAVLGVACLDTRWTFGMGRSHALIFVAAGAVPSWALARVISRLPTYPAFVYAALAGFGGMAFSAYLSYWLALAMVGV